MKRKDELTEVEFDPQNPKCPHCHSRLQKSSCVKIIRYEEQKGNLYIHVCPCGTATGYFALDTPNGSPYLLGKIK